MRLSLNDYLNKILWVLQRRLLNMPRLYGLSLSERIVEYPWVLKNIEGRRILDVGCHGTFFPLSLANCGYKVVGVDVKEWRLSHPNYTFIKCSAKSMPFKKNQFDTITCISTLEHISVSETLEGELEVMNNFKRILKSGGVILMTFGYGNNLKVEGNEVVYDEESVEEIIEGFNVEERDLFHRKENGWIRTKEPIEGKHKDIICLKLRHKDIT